MRATMLIPLIFLSQAALTGENAELVERFISAFNQQDVDLMLELSAPELRWMSVSGDQISTETSTRAELREAMTGYFGSTPGARAEVRSISESGRFVHTLEEAFWLSGGNERSRCSMAVYELAGGKLLNVWYFPAHQCP